MTNDNQPAAERRVADKIPERIWLVAQDGSPLPSWYKLPLEDGLYSREREYEYIRADLVHQLRLSVEVERRVAEGLWEALKRECCIRPEKAELITFLSRDKFLKVVSPLVHQQPQVSERCVVCGHNDLTGGAGDGYCRALVWNEDGSRTRCGCKCAFPAVAIAPTAATAGDAGQDEPDIYDAVAELRERSAIDNAIASDPALKEAFDIQQPKSYQPSTIAPGEGARSWVYNAAVDIVNRLGGPNQKAFANNIAAIISTYMPDAGEVERLRRELDTALRRVARFNDLNQSTYERLATTRASAIAECVEAVYVLITRYEQGVERSKDAYNFGRLEADARLETAKTIAAALESLSKGEGEDGPTGE